MNGSLGTQLASFEAAVTQLWSEYGKRGPGRVAPERFHALRDAYLSLESAALAGDLRDDLQKLFHLGERCVQRSEGLCFISGEAGLVPRPDLHSQFESALTRLRAQVNAQMNRD